MRHPTRLLTASAVCLALAVFGFFACFGDEELKPADAQRGQVVAMRLCTFCHLIDGRGGMIAPPLEKGLSLADQFLRDYEKRAAELKARHPSAYVAAEPAIERVLAEKDHAQRFELWLDAYLTDTKFDNPMTKMGNVILTTQQRVDVVAWLMTRRPAQ